MSAIGPVIRNLADVDWDVIAYHGAFHIFRDETHLLRCVVWRDEETGEIFGHNFDYTRATSRDWWTAHEDATPDGCLQAVSPSSREGARLAVSRFRQSTYAALVAGVVALDEIAPPALMSVPDCRMLRPSICPGAAALMH